MEFQLRLIDLNGNIIKRPSDITNREFTAIGRLEVLYNGHWGTVCSDGFTSTSREVACKQLGYIRSTDTCMDIYVCVCILYIGTFRLIRCPLRVEDRFGCPM